MVVSKSFDNSKYNIFAGKYERLSEFGRSIYLRNLLKF